MREKKEGEELNHGIILHEEYRERMKSFSPERLGKLVHNMFLVDEGLEPEIFPDDEALDVLSEVVCARLKRDIAMSEKQRNNRLGKTKQEPKKTKNNQTITKQKPRKTPITNNQLPITNNQYKKQYGVCENVLLTEEEHQKIVSAGYTELIDELSLYIDSKGAKYKSHYSTILSWARRREKEAKVVSMSGQNAKNQFNRFTQRDDYDIEAIERKLIRN